MNHETEIDALRGQLAALNGVLISVISTLSPLQKAQCAVSLAVEKQAASQQDADEQTPPTEAAARDTVMQAYLELLSAAVR